jgi:hypothetical protein
LPDQETKLAYNGIKVTKAALSVSTTAENKMPSLDHWHEHGGLVARGVLIDYKYWYEQKAAAEGKSGADAVCHPFDGHRINISDIEAVAKQQNVEFRPGDVQQKLQLSGVDGSMATVKWLWNQHFAAVAGDSIAFEAIPPLNEEGESAEMENLGRCTFNSQGLY